jgi:hypothetical protein
MYDDYMRSKFKVVVLLIYIMLCREGDDLEVEAQRSTADGKSLSICLYPSSFLGISTSQVLSYATCLALLP